LKVQGETLAMTDHKFWAERPSLQLLDKATRAWLIWLFGFVIVKLVKNVNAMDCLKLEPSACARNAFSRSTRHALPSSELLDYLHGLCPPDLAEGYRGGLADMDRALARQIAELLELVRQ
jgi:hypothetical protein